jgi:tetratricopeptide (TPR) repeat protein
MEENSTLVLEIVRQGEALSMSVFEQRELASTLRHYSKISVSFPEIENLCQEVTSILRRADKAGVLEADLLRNLEKTGQLLWDHLLTKTVKDRLRAAPAAADLVLSLDEELISIPWEILNTGGDFLCLKFNLGRIVRTGRQTSPTQYRSLTNNLKMLILANPTGDLKSAYIEGTFIKNQFDKNRKEILIDFKSTDVDSLYVKRNLRDYDIVHFAGHCEYDANEPKNSGWVLSDKRFTVQDILTLGQTLALPTLVFSNACYSAKVDDAAALGFCQEGTYNLASAFLFSGVRLYIGTIRRIEDPVSLTFAKNFYAQLVAGKSVGASLRLARLKLIKEYGGHCIHWLSYLLYGDPGFALFKGKPEHAKIIKPKLKLAPYRKHFLKFAIAVSIIFIGLFLYMGLLNLNPTAAISFHRARALFLRGKNPEVIAIASRIIKDEPMYLEAYPLLADTSQRMGDRDLALKYLFAYAMASEKKDERNNLTNAYIKIGWVYYLQGEYPKALEFYQRALALGSRNRDKLNEADVLGKMALWYMDKGASEQALELLTKSAEINRARQNIYQHRYNLACDYFNLALLFVNKDDYTTAKEFYAKSFAIFDKLNLAYELSDCYFNVGEIYLFEKQYQKALDSYLKGLQIDRQQGNLPNQASDYDMIGELYVEMGDLDQAEKFFNQALAVAGRIKAPLEAASIYYNLGRLYKGKGQNSRAREYLEKSLKIYKSIDTSDYRKVEQELSRLN